MKMLLIGGTGFIGPHTAAALIRSGHRVTVFHRGSAGAPAGTEEILGNRRTLQDPS